MFRRKARTALFCAPALRPPCRIRARQRSNRCWRPRPASTLLSQQAVRRRTSSATPSPSVPPVTAPARTIAAPRWGLLDDLYGSGADLHVLRDVGGEEL